MIVVADASPLNYLVQIGREALLERLYRQVLIPTAVFNELQDDKAPQIVGAWTRRLPQWISVHSVALPDDALDEELGLGEREAIALALAKGAGLVLIDDRLGRHEAERCGLEVTGVLGVLLAAGRHRLIDPESEFVKLISATNFRVTRRIRQTFLSAAREFQSGA